jgi:hypothetical protein
MKENLIVERPASLGCRVGNVFRKYYKYADANAALTELRNARTAFLGAVPCPEPLDVGYSELRKMHYCAFRFHKLEKIDPRRLTLSEWQSLIMICQGISDVRCNGPLGGGSWAKYVSGLETTLPYVPERVRSALAKELDGLRCVSNDCFTHGDFSFVNIARDGETGELMVFDFQDSCRGVRNWDWAYFLASVPVDIAEEWKPDRSVRKLMRIVSAVKLARARRKKTEVGFRTEIFDHWWRGE